jgi:hypothetical protein
MVVIHDKHTKTRFMYASGYNDFYVLHRLP